LFNKFILSINHFTKVMKKGKLHINTILLVFSILLCLHTPSSAQSYDWENPSIKTTNALPFRQAVFSYANQAVAFDRNEKNSSRVKSLNGIWQFYWLKRPADIPADFLDENLNYPNKIKVPSN